MFIRSIVCVITSSNRELVNYMQANRIKVDRDQQNRVIFRLIISLNSAFMTTLTFITLLFSLFFFFVLPINAPKIMFWMSVQEVLILGEILREYFRK